MHTSVYICQHEIGQHGRGQFHFTSLGCAWVLLVFKSADKSMTSLDRPAAMTLVETLFETSAFGGAVYIKYNGTKSVATCGIFMI